MRFSFYEKNMLTVCTNDIMLLKLYFINTCCEKLIILNKILHLYNFLLYLLIPIACPTLIDNFISK